MTLKSFNILTRFPKMVSHFSRLILFSLIFVSSSCSKGFFAETSKIFIKTSSNSSASFLLSGTVHPFFGSIVEHKPMQDLFFPKAYAAVCVNPVVVGVYKVLAGGEIDSSPLLTQTLTASATFNFDLGPLGVKLSSKSDLLILATGCNDEIFARPVLSEGNQDISNSSTLLSYSVLSNLTNKLADVDRTTVDTLMSALAGSSPQNVYTTLVGDAPTQTIFNTTFGGSHTLLQEAAPLYKATVATTIPEGSATTFSVLAKHWDPGYTVAYVWKWDGVSVGTAATLNYTPTANSQGSHTLTLLVGKDAGGAVLDLTKPYATKTYSITVQNILLPAAPALALNTPAANPVGTRNITLEIATGALMANCASFSNLAITEEDTAAPVNPALYTISCSVAGTQTFAYTLVSPSDGNKTLRLWAMDSSGLISSAASSLLVTLNTGAPLVALVAPNGGSYYQGGATFDITWRTSTGAGFAATPVALDYHNGTAWVSIATNQLNSDNGTGCTLPTLGGYTDRGCYRWTVPAIDCSSCQVRVTVTDNLVQAGSDSSDATFVIDNTNPTPVLTSANGGQLLKGGATQALTWTTTGIDTNITATPISLEYSSNSGGAWSSITSGLSNSGSYNWTVPSVSSSTYRVRVVATDLSGRTGAYASTTDFEIDSTAPVITLGSLANISGNPATTSTLNFTITEKNISNSQNFTVSYSTDSGGTWPTSQTIAAVSGPLTNYAYSGTITPPNSASTTFRIKVDYTDLAGNSVTVQTADISLDSTLPTLTAASLNFNGETDPTRKGSILVDFAATDTAPGKVKKICVKDSATAPSASNGCWNSVDQLPGAVAVTPATSVTINDLPYVTGTAAGVTTYTLYAWVMDEAGNISAHTNTVNTDKKSITYSPGTPPQAVIAYAAAIDAHATPPAGADLVAASGSDVYVKWEVKDLEDDAVPLKLKVSLEYTTDEINFIAIAGATNVDADIASSCTVPAATQGGTVGCYKWSLGSPTNNYLRIIVKVKDSDNTISVLNSNPINVGTTIQILAGNTNPGIGASAKAASLFSAFDPADGIADPQNFVVLTDGTIVIRDRYNGILKVSPSDGIIRQILPIGASIEDGDLPANGGSAKVYRPFKIAVDWSDNIYIYDYRTIRKLMLSPTTGNPRIQTIIGAAPGGDNIVQGGEYGASSAVDIATASTMNILAAGEETYMNSRDAKSRVFQVIGNGDIIFQPYVRSSYDIANAGSLIRYYHADTGAISSLKLQGTGHSINGSQLLDTCFPNNFGFGYNISAPTTFTAVQVALLGCGLAIGGTSRFNSNINDGGAAADYFVAEAPHNPSASDNWNNIYSYRYTGLDGEMYMVSFGHGQFSRFNTTTSVYDAIAGGTISAVGECADGIDGGPVVTSASCNLKLISAFVSKTGKVYLNDNGKIRIIGSDNKFLTMAGQSYSFGDNGAATSARFGVIRSIDMDNANKIVMLDSQEYRFREFSRNGVITKIAGTGKNAATTLLGEARNLPFYTSSNGPMDDFVLDKVNGYIMYPYWSGAMARLNRNYDFGGGVFGRAWESLFGNTGGTIYSSAADGTVGSSVHIGPFYLQLPIGFSNGKLIVAHSNYSGGYIDSMIKMYDTTDSYKIYHILGNTGASTTTPCAANGTFTSTTCNVAVPVLGDTQSRYFYDSAYVANGATGRWITVKPNTNIVFYVPFGGSARNVDTLTTTTEPIKAFAYYNNAGTQYIYYCGGTTNQLRRKIVGGSDDALEWTIPSMTCENRSMVYDPAGNLGAGSLIFIFKQNNLYGIGEHLDLIP